MTIDHLRGHAHIGRGGYRVFGGKFRQMSVTLEEAEFLYALVRLARPERVLELGSGYGVSGRFIGEALADNAPFGGRLLSGRLLTVEPDPVLADAAAMMLASVPADVGEPVDGDLDWGLVFIDSGYKTRQDDITYWLTNGYKGLVCVHDANREYDIAGGAGVVLPCADGLWLGRAA